MERVGFKEWALVCQALGRGEQCIILRKGGIAEGRAGFAFRHPEFFLFPTFFHEQIAKVRTPLCELPDATGAISIRYWAKVERSAQVPSLENAGALRPLHILADEVVHERWNYRGEGLQVAFVRVFTLPEPWILIDDERFGGCRSWVDLPDPPQSELQPVLNDTTHAQLREQFDSLSSGFAPTAACPP